jgi:hypothetical protein
MSPAPTLYRISPTTTAGQLSFEQAWEQGEGGPLASGYSHLVPVTVSGAPRLLATEPGSGAITAFTLTDGDPWFTPAGTGLTLGGAFDIVEPFVLGDEPYLLAYAADAGEMSFFPVGADLSLDKPYTFFRTRAPGITNGFTVTKPIVVGGLVYVLAYSRPTGKVGAYGLAVTATPQPGAPAGTPPLLATPVWDHEWARDWTHFAFFELGSENFFFKINTGKLNVNIDHVLDDPALGTAEVGTYLELPDALELDIVRSFMLGGDPYFITYKTDGTTTVNRFRGDCQGWTQQSASTAVAGASDIVPLSVGENTYALFY